MDFTDEQLRAAAKILKKVVESQEIKTVWGAHKREALKNALAAGKPIGGYRVQWLIETRQALAKTLVECADKFNELYKHDRISAVDMEDAVLSTLQRLRVATTKSGKPS